MTTYAEATAAAGQILANATARIAHDLATGGALKVAQAAFTPGGPPVEELTRRAAVRFGVATSDAA